MGAAPIKFLLPISWMVSVSGVSLIDPGGMFAHGQCKFAALSTAHAVSMLGATRDGT